MPLTSSSGSLIQGVRQLTCIDTCKVLNFNLGGVSQQGVQNKDWVDASVAGWIESETKSMEEAWGPATRRSALAFVHIPPLVSIY